MHNQIGIIGLGTMGKALAMNFMNHGVQVVGYNRSPQVVNDLSSIYPENFIGASDLANLVLNLQKPRRVFLMLPANQIIDSFIEQLIALLDEGDIIMDGGNSYFKDTKRRSEYVEKHHLHYFGIGISGGEQGALLGPSIMPSGNQEAYAHIAPLLELIAAKKEGEPCCAYISTDGAGHYVKMVHNGIEYADMQLIAEVYLILKYNMKLSNLEMAQVFEEWQNSEVQSYLVEITSKILKEKDPQDKGELIDYIKDSASQKGTGKWTVLEAVDQGDNVSVIYSALNARIMSNQTQLRETYQYTQDNTSSNITLEQLHSAYALTKMSAYAQGFAQIQHASMMYEWHIDLRSVAAIFRAGCIIQAKFLSVLMEIFSTNQNCTNILFSDQIKAQVDAKIDHLRIVVIDALTRRSAIVAMTNALLYLDQIYAEHLGANLIQAQRDFFGAHTFERTDLEGVIHHEWGNE